MPGIRFQFIRDDAQEQWVDKVEDLQPATETTYIWSSEQIKPTREGLQQLFDRFISGTFKLNSEETVTSDYVFVRARNSEFNYSENPSFISGSTGDVLYSQFINSPQSYVTTVGFYNDTNDLVAVAKLSKPLTKDFTKEALIRVKLDF